METDELPTQCDHLIHNHQRMSASTIIVLICCSVLIVQAILDVCWLAGRLPVLPACLPACLLPCLARSRLGPYAGECSDCYNTGIYSGIYDDGGAVRWLAGEVLAAPDLRTFCRLGVGGHAENVAVRSQPY